MTEEKLDNRIKEGRICVTRYFFQLSSRSETLRHILTEKMVDAALIHLLSSAPVGKDGEAGGE